MTLRRVALLIAPIILLSATSASAACWTDDGDDDAAESGEQSSPPDDDSSAADDDASDDDADNDFDDDSVDDDLDDDFDDDFDDDVDDDSDDDTTDDDVDDDAFAGCEGGIYGSDDCAKWMHELYCGFEYPLIFGDTLYTQGEAVDGCRGSSDPRWHAIVECATRTAPEPGEGTFCDFVSCLSESGWHAQHLDVFDAADYWHPIDADPATETFAAFNFQCIISDDPFDQFRYWQMNGAIRRLLRPELRAEFFYFGVVGGYAFASIADGNSILVSDALVTFWMTGWFVAEGSEGGTMEYFESELGFVHP